MPPAIIAAAIGGAATVGSSIYSSSQAKKANNKALDAQNLAAERQLEEQRAAREQITGLQQPFVQGGYSALDAILKKYNLAPSGGAAPATTQTAPYGGNAGQTNMSNPAYVSQGGTMGAGGRAPPAGGWSDPTPAERRASGGADGGGTSDTGGINYGNGGSVPNYGTPQGGAPAPQSAPQASGEPQPDWNAFLQANPDVVEYYKQTPEAQKLSIQDFAADVYKQQGDIRGAPPMLPAQPAPQGPEPYVPEYTRPDQPVWQGAGAAPNQADFLDPSKFSTSPGYEFRLGEGNRNLNAKYGARGLLKSGGAIKGFTDYNQGAASAEYGNWFNQQKSLYDSALSQYNNDRSANYNIFNTERNNTNQNFADDRSYGTNLGLANRAYDTNRDDTTTNNLFKLVGVGTGAAGATGNAASNYANTAGNIYGNQANAAGDAAYGNAAANAQLGGALAGVGANLFNGASRVGGAAANSNTSGQVNLGSLNYGSIFPSSSRVGVF